MQIRHISKCINSKLSKICMEAIQLEELSYLVAAYLPDELRPHCQVGSFRSGKLTLVTTHANWATTLRYAIPELRDALRSQAKLHQLISIDIKIDMPKKS